MRVLQTIGKRHTYVDEHGRQRTGLSPHKFRQLRAMFEELVASAVAFERMQAALQAQKNNSSDANNQVANVKLHVYVSCDDGQGGVINVPLIGDAVQYELVPNDAELDHVDTLSCCTDDDSA